MSINGEIVRDDVYLVKEIEMMVKDVYLVKEIEVSF